MYLIAYNNCIELKKAAALFEFISSTIEKKLNEQKIKEQETVLLKKVDTYICCWNDRNLTSVWLQVCVRRGICVASGEGDGAVGGHETRVSGAETG